MPVQLHANNATTTISGNINNSATSITLATGTGGRFPGLTTGQYFMGALDDGTNVEIVKVTARASDTLTVVRGQDNTTANAFNSGSTFRLAVIRSDMSNFGRAGLGSAYWPPATPNSLSDYFNDQPSMSGPQNGVDAKWTQVNMAGVSVSTLYDRLTLGVPSAGGTNFNLRQFTQNAPATPWTCVVRQQVLASATFHGAGIFVRDNATGKLVTWGVRANGASTSNTTAIVQWSYQYETMTSQTVRSATVSQATNVWFHTEQIITLYLKDDGVNFTMGLMPDGVTPVQMVSAGRTAFLATPDRFGWFADNLASSAHTAILYYFDVR